MCTRSSAGSFIRLFGAGALADESQSRPGLSSSAALGCLPLAGPLCESQGTSSTERFLRTVLQYAILLFDESVVDCLEADGRWEEEEDDSIQDRRGVVDLFRIGMPSTRRDQFYYIDMCHHLNGSYGSSTAAISTRSTADHAGNECDCCARTSCESTTVREPFQRLRQGM